MIVVLLIWPLIYTQLTDSNYALNVMTQAGLYAILTISVGLVLGQAGQLSFGHSAFYGIGAYTCGLLVLKFGVPTLLAWMAGAAAAGVVALIVGRPVLKLKYFYLALATMGLGQIFLAVVFEWKWAGASNGFGPVSPLNIFGFEFDTQLRRYYMVWVVGIIILLFVARLLKYRVGRALRGLAVSEIASSTLGVRNPNWKLLAFIFNAVFCGIAGGLFAFVYMAVSPQNFSFAASVLPIVMMLVGGDRYVYGWVVGRRAHDLGLQRLLPEHAAVQRHRVLGDHDPAPAVPAGGSSGSAAQVRPAACGRRSRKRNSKRNPRPWSSRPSPPPTAAKGAPTVRARWSPFRRRRGRARLGRAQ